MRKSWKINLVDVGLAMSLIAFAVVTRLLIHGQNLEVFTAVSLLAGSLLRRWFAVLIPLVIVALTDMVIGNSSILFFTWSAWAAIGVFGLLLRREKKSTARFTVQMTGMGVGATMFFFFWTNAGVWLLGDGVWYPHTPAGLLQSYINGLPFLRPQLLGNLITVPVVTFFFTTILSWVQARYPRLASDLAKKN